MASQEGDVDEKEVRLAVDLYVCKASKEDLLLLADKLKIPDEKLEVPEFKLKVVILDHVGDVLEKKTRGERVNFMKEILVCLGAERDLPSLEGEEDERSRPVHARQRGLLDSDTGDIRSAAGMGQDRIDGGEVKSRKGIMSLESNLSAHESGVNMRSSLFRREFRIRGSIGEPGQSEKLNFVSLANQIDSGLRKGYDEDEIVDGVIQAITPGLHLRSFLEASPSLTLAFVRKTLRSHYREKDATSLYQELAVCHQKGNETPMAFLMRALDLRQKVLFSCQEQDARIKYNREIVQKTFINALKTGLRPISTSFGFRISHPISDFRTTNALRIQSTLPRRSDESCVKSRDFDMARSLNPQSWRAFLLLFTKIENGCF